MLVRVHQYSKENEEINVDKPCFRSFTYIGGAASVDDFGHNPRGNCKNERQEHEFNILERVAVGICFKVTHSQTGDVFSELISAADIK